MCICAPQALRNGVSTANILNPRFVSCNSSVSFCDSVLIAGISIFFLFEYVFSGQIRPDRQTAMFSATFRGKVERLAADSTRNPIRIVVGVAGQSAASVTQVCTSDFIE